MGYHPFSLQGRGQGTNNVFRRWVAGALKGHGEGFFDLHCRHGALRDALNGFCIVLDFRRERFEGARREHRGEVDFRHTHEGCRNARFLCAGDSGEQLEGAF